MPPFSIFLPLWLAVRHNLPDNRCLMPEIGCDDIDDIRHAKNIINPIIITNPPSLNLLAISVFFSDTSIAEKAKLPLLEL